MYITGFLLIIIQSSCIGMDWSRKLQSSHQRQNGNHASYGAQYRHPAISTAINSYAVETLLTPYPFTATL